MKKSGGILVHLFLPSMTERPRRWILAFFIFSTFAASPIHAQLILPTGGNHPELHWNELQTDHFLIIYHNGLDSIAYKAAPLAEEAYRVVTGNLKTPVNKKVKIYLSDYDEVKNAFAFEDDYIFIWMRGILDDLPYGFRSSGTAKWLRTVITHEFTHIVIAYATKDFTFFLAPQSMVPRWFNEGLARFMEPDGWTSDLDAILRVATVSGHLDLGGTDDYLAGGLTYEGGHSLVRYIASTYGDSAIVKILKHSKYIFYDFDESVRDVTKKTLSEIVEDWKKTLNVYFNTNYGQKEEASEFARKINTGLAVVLAARLEPGGKRIAIIGARSKESPSRLYIYDTESSKEAELISEDAGIEPVISWYPGKEALCISKYHVGSNGNLIHDLYRVDIESKDMTRLTNDGRYEEPDVALQANRIVAVRSEQNHSDLYLMNYDGKDAEQLTKYNDANTQVYAPRWSNDGKKITYSVFRSNGMRDIAVINVETKEITLITNDSLNDRASIFSPNNKNVVFLSHRNGIPNIYQTSTEGNKTITQMTDIAGAMFPWDWSGSKDSILVTSFDTRNSVSLYWMPEKREVKSAAIPALKEKYTDWRTIQFPLMTRSADSIPQVTLNDLGSYNSLGHIRPILFLPFIASDKSLSGKSGMRFGFIGAAFDPMQKHAFSLLMDYGAESNTLGTIISYTNRQLYQNITLSAEHTYGFKRSLANRALYQRDLGGSVTVSQVFPAPNSLTTSHSVAIAGAFRKLEPVNPLDFDSLRFEQTPINYKGFDIGLQYILLSRDLIFRAGLMHSLGDLTYTRAKMNFNYKIPFDEDRNVLLGLRGAAIAQFGAQIPQEYVGFRTDEVFENGYNPLSLEYSYRLRGIRRAYYGDRLMLGSVELILPDLIFSSVVPLVAAILPSLVGFYDIGSVWYDKTPTNYPSVQTSSLAKTTWLQSGGVELRSGIEGVFTIGAGVGWELKTGSHADWYFRITTYF